MNSHRRRRILAALSAAAFSLLSVPANVAGARALTPALSEIPSVLVVGGTPAGVAAAVTAARRGARVTLVSASGDLGGTLTDAMMDQWDLNLAPDGARIQHGIFDEIYARLGDAFTPESASRTFAAMVAAEPSIRVRYDDAAVGVDTTSEPDGRRVDGVTFRDARTDALETIRAPYVIDATDSGDVAVLAGARYDVGRQDSGIDERMQAVTEMYAMSGVNWAALAATYDAGRYGAGGVVGRRAWGYARLLRAYRPGSPDVVVRDLNLGLLPDGDVTVNAIDVCGVDALEPAQLALAKARTEAEAPRLLAFLRPRLPGLRDARIAAFAPEVYVRETRHIAGVERLTTHDVWAGSIPADSIGLSSYPIDLHPVDPTDEPAYAPERHVYGIPFGALVPKGLTNLLLASPAISASHLASGSARVIPTTIEEGEACALAIVATGSAAFDFASAARAGSFLATMRRDLAREDAAHATMLRT